jgi:hypothetical protein
MARGGLALDAVYPQAISSSLRATGFLNAGGSFKF